VFIWSRKILNCPGIPTLQVRKNRRAGEIKGKKKPDFSDRLSMKYYSFS